MRRRRVDDRQGAVEGEFGDIDEEAEAAERRDEDVQPRDRKPVEARGDLSGPDQGIGSAGRRLRRDGAGLSAAGGPAAGSTAASTAPKRIAALIRR